jgi:hypothetical protein
VKTKRREIGGPVPRPFNRAVARLAGVIVESRVTGKPVEVPPAMSPAAVSAAVRAAEALEEARTPLGPYAERRWCIHNDPNHQPCPCGCGGCAGFDSFS